MTRAPGAERHEHLLSDRKHRLLASGLCRQVAPHVDRPELVGVLDASESFADGLLTPVELARARQFALDVARSHAEIPEHEKYALAVAMTASVTPPSLRTLYKSVEPNTASLVDKYLRGALELLADGGTVLPAMPGYAALFDEVAPRAATIPAAWLTDTVSCLARQMYDSGDFGAMPILADALQDAGCDNDEVLHHCRAEPPHARGCWVVDLVLGNR